MKTILTEIIALAATLSGFALPSAFADALPNGAPFPAPEQVSIPSDGLFAPPGSDDTSNVQIVIQGSLPSTCYKTSRPQVSVDRETRRISVAAQAFLYASASCVNVKVPFIQTIDLGLLPAGRYRVVESDRSGKVIREVPLSVGVSISPDPADFLYAPVEHLRIDYSQAARTAILDGVFSSGCMSLQEVRVLHPAIHVIELLPVAIHKNGVSCEPGSSPFEARVALPQIEPGDTLVHVRSLSGVSLNEVEFSSR